MFSLAFSNLLFLAIGLFLTVSVSIAHATWNDAKTSGSGQLSEANWDALVDMIETSGGGGCVNNYCFYRWASNGVPSNDCSCAALACPSGFASAGTSGMFETSYFNTNRGWHGGTMGDSRFCCK